MKEKVKDNGFNSIEMEGESINIIDNDLQQQGLKRSLTFLDSYSIIVGIIIGSGIFSSPGVALERAGSPGAVLLAWTCSGILVCITAQCYFELGCLYPTAGGDYDYLLNRLEIYHNHHLLLLLLS